MIEGIGSAVMQLFKFLTPSEISRLTETASKRSANSMSAVDAASIALNLDVSSNNSNKEDPYADKVVEEISEETFQEDKNKKEEQKNNVQALKRKPSVAAAYQGGAALKLEVSNDVDFELSKEQSHLESVGIVSAAKIQSIQAKREYEERMSEPSPTVFLLLEQAKVKASCEKLKGQVAIDQYKNVSKHEIIKITEDVKKSKDEKTEEEDELSKIIGVLVDRRQY